MTACRVLAVSHWICMVLETSNTICYLFDLVLYHVLSLTLCPARWAIGMLFRHSSQLLPHMLCSPPEVFSPSYPPVCFPHLFSILNNWLSGKPSSLEGYSPFFFFMLWFYSNNSSLLTTVFIFTAFIMSSHKNIKSVKVEASGSKSSRYTEYCQ